MNGLSIEIDLDIQSIDGAEGEPQILVLVVGLLDLEEARYRSGPHRAGDARGDHRFDAGILPQHHLDIRIFDDVPAFAGQVVIEMGLRDRLVSELPEQGGIHESAWRHDFA